ncbi:PREDICTED: polyamine oxidase-like [Amphimedon queenslandica]|uniref:Amine oxidase n=1 Tax=Amphimedon queenslandica TaxID=400682 RepID=A0AAN0JIR4_AMPQE|nr:PREDICTED: polyamine oxidase-like [Amphimedon queenslandica]|eukprot:XP_019856691.1 PREDICTED: polyamine oxidase-like [Amphimedon queenslandica]
MDIDMEHRFLFLLFLFFSFVLKESASKCPYRTDAEVLIFGAGTAGVTAARVLNDHGLNSFKVLEAHDKIGGRIRNITFKGFQIEVGANWIHEAPGNTGSRSDNDNPIWTLARDNQYRCDVDLEGVDVLISGGFTESSIFMDFNNQAQQYETFNTSEIEMDYIAKYKEALKTNGTNTVRQGLNMNNWRPDSPLKQLIEWSEFDFTYAATPNESVVSLTAENDNVNFGERCFIVTDQRGFASVLRCMIANFGDHQDKILTNTNVTSIELYSECVCAEVMGQGRMCGDYGIVTFSIGVLQNWIANNKFKGTSLSPAKIRAITNSRMGLYLKIFVKFPNVFWNISASYTYATNSTKRGYYPVLQPIGASLPGSPPIVLMSVTGDEAMRISHLSKGEVRQEVVAVLRQWYNIENESLLTITNDDIEYHDWSTDEFFLGMFSNNPTTLTIDDKRNLAMPEGRLYFSGEANSIEHGGTIHGAYCSGMDAATEILKRAQGEILHKNYSSYMV